MNNVIPGPGTLSGGRQATAREFFAVVFRRKWLIVGLFLVVTATVLTVGLSTPMVYDSSGRCMLKRGEQQSSMRPERQVTSNWEEDLGSEIEIVKSFPVMERARAILADQAAHGGRRIKLNPVHVDVEVVGRTNVVGIGYHDLNPAVARQACDAVLNAYVEYRQHTLMMSYPKSFFDQQIGDVRRQLDQLLERRREFTNQNGVVNLDDQGRTWLGELGVLNQRKSEVMTDLAEAGTAQRLMRELQKNPEIDLPTIGPSGQTQYTNESALVELQRKLVEQEARVASLRERYRDESPEVSGAQTTLETIRTMLRREVEARFELSQSRVEVLEARLAQINKDAAVMQARLDAMPNQETTLAEMDAQITVLKQRFNELSRQSDEARVTENTVPTARILLLSPAGPAVARNTRDYVRLALAPAFSIVVGIGLAFFMDGLDLTVRTAGHAEETLELPVLASVPERRRKRA